MREFVIHHECTALVDALSPLASSVKDAPIHWIDTPAGTYESNHYGSDWCADCGYYMIRHLRKRDRKHASDYRLDGGWATEEEHLAYCAGCGIRLRVSLLRYGALNELEHYRECGFSSKPAEDAYDLTEVLECYSVTSDDEGAAEAAEAIDLARRFAVIQGIVVPPAETQAVEVGK